MRSASAASSRAGAARNASRSITDDHNGCITDRKAYAQLTLTAAIWGLSWLCGRIVSSSGIPAAHASLGRFAFGSLGLLAVMWFNRPWPSVTARNLLLLGAMGFCGVFLYNVCFFNGLRTVPAGRASLMAALQPSVVFVFSAVVWSERITPVKIAGLLTSFAGAMLVLSQGDVLKLFGSGLNTGDLWVLGCVFSWVAYTLLGRTLGGTIAPGPATAYSTWLGTIPLLALAAFQGGGGPSWTLAAWAAVAFLGFAGTTLGFLLYLRGLAQIGASRASIFINLVPVFGVLFSTVFLRESLSAATLAGGALVIAGVRLLNRR